MPSRTLLGAAALLAVSTLSAGCGAKADAPPAAEHSVTPSATPTPTVGTADSATCVFALVYDGTYYEHRGAKGTQGASLGYAEFPPCNDTGGSGVDQEEHDDAAIEVFEVVGVDPSKLIWTKNYGVLTAIPPDPADTASGSAE